MVGAWLGGGWPASERLVADDGCALHLARGRPVVLYRVVLGAAVVPNGHAVRPPAEPHLVFGNRRLADQVVQQMARARGLVLPVAHVLWRMEVREMRGEAADVEHLLASLRMRAHHGVFDHGVLRGKLGPILRAHRRAE